MPSKANLANRLDNTCTNITEKLRLLEEYEKVNNFLSLTVTTFIPIYEKIPRLR